MGQQYNDIYARDTLSDTGIWPSLDTSSWCSPDIITYGQSILSWKNAADKYGAPIFKDVISGTVNNCYVRGKNLAPDARTGSVSLYITPCSLLITPKKWTPLRTADGQFSSPFICGEVVTDIIPPQTVCINRSAFVFDFPQQGHFCFVSFIDTLHHPKVIPTEFNSNLGLDAWVRENPSIAQQNVSTYYPLVDELTDKVDFGNENAHTSNFVIALSFKGVAGRPFPEGLTVMLQNSDAMFPFEYNTRTPYMDSNGEQTLFINIPNMPGKYHGTFTVIIKNNSLEPLSGSIMYDYFECLSTCTAEEEKYLLTPKFDLISPDGQLIVRAGKKALLRLGSCAKISEDNPAVQTVFNRKISYTLW